MAYITMEALKRCMMVYLLVMLTVFCQCFGAEGWNEPHVIIITADDVGSSDLEFFTSGKKSFNNYLKEVLTYSKTTVLKNYYVSPNGHSSRAALMTGLHPASLGAQFEHQNSDATVQYGLDTSKTLLPEYLKMLPDYKFDTHAVGQWDLGFYSQSYLPTNRGYDTFSGQYLQYGDYLSHQARDEQGHVGFDLHKDEDLLRSNENGFKTELYGRLAGDIIRDHSNREESRSLHLYVAFQAAQIHDFEEVCNGEKIPSNYYDTLEYETDAQRKCYLALLTALDGAFGNILDALKQNAMLLNSIIIFTTTSSGASASAGEDLNFASNYPYRGTKNTVWEGGVKGSAFIYNPFDDNASGAAESDCMFHISDWIPTIHHSLAKAKGRDLGQMPQLYGKDQYGCLYKGEESRRDSIVHVAYGNSAAITKNGYKYIFDEGGHYSNMDEWYGSSRSGLNSCPGGQQTECKPTEKPCLFNLNQDPCEKNNIAAQFPDEVSNLSKLVQEFNRTVNYEVQFGPDVDGNPARFRYPSWQPWVDVNSAHSLKPFPLVLLIISVLTCFSIS